MSMRYTITTPGSGAGGSRADVAKTIDADAVDASTFGLKDEPENIWKSMVNANVGVFNKNALSKFNKKVKDSTNQDVNLTPQQDGWGVP
jgi:hypothetical protein